MPIGQPATCDLNGRLRQDDVDRLPLILVTNVRAGDAKVCDQIVNRVLLG